MKAILIITLSFFTATAFGKVDPKVKTTKDCTNYKQFTNVQPAEMTKIVKEKSATIIDVNSNDSFEKSNIPGSFHYASNETKFADKLPKNKKAPIIAYCGGEMCTAWHKAAKKACELGYTNIRHFKAGITGWNEMQKGNKPKKG